VHDPQKHTLTDHLDISIVCQPLQRKLHSSSGIEEGPNPPAAL
jgi:hypothetical protein